MPTLNLIGKDAVVNRHRTVPYRLLRDVPELGVGDPGTAKGKAVVGAVWEQRSGGRCLFAMPTKGELAEITAKVAR